MINDTALAELEEIVELMKERKIREEKMSLTKNLLDVLDNKSIAEKTGLDINSVRILRIQTIRKKFL